jgi:UDP-glucose:(heptosyl)LPS alpha-1,3-glucosyltransferase
MKIAIIVRRYDKRGGISRYAAELAEGLAAGNEVHVFASSWRDVGNAAIRFHRIPMLSFGFLVRRKKIALNNIFEIISFALFSRFLVKTAAFDVVHSQGGFIGKFDVVTAHSCHAASLAAATGQDRSIGTRLRKSRLNPLHAVLLFLENYSMRHARLIIAVSHGVRAEIMAHYRIPGNRIVAVHNGVAVHQFTADNRNVFRKRLRQRYGLAATDRIILFPAHEFERKGLRQLIETQKLLAINNLYVLVAGRGDHAPFLPLLQRYGLRDKCIFAGDITGIEEYFAASDMVVFPTSYEPFGLIITEAMASGLPVIVTRSAGASELIADRVNGILLKDHRDVAGMAEAVRYLLSSPLERTVMEVKARETAERFSWEKMAGRILSLYDSLAHPSVEPAGTKNTYAGVSH